jgi:hypothetical protein
MKTVGDVALRRALGLLVLVSQSADPAGAEACRYFIFPTG